MQHLRRFGFFALVAVALAGCGTVATTLLPASPPTPSCPRPGMPAPTKSFCLTASEIQRGEQEAHIPGIPDAVFLYENASFTTSPRDTSAISQSQAEQAALKYAISLYPGTRLIGSVLVESHYACGTPAVGTLVWIVALRPPKGAVTDGSRGTTPIAYMSVGVNPVSGKVFGLGTLSGLPKTDPSARAARCP